MSQAAVLVGILVGWATSAVWRSAGMGNAWMDRLIGVIGGLVGAFLAGTLGSGDPIPVAIWAWAGAVILSDVVALAGGGRR